MFQTTNQLIVANPIIPSPTESTIGDRLHSRDQLFREGGTAGTREPEMDFGSERSLGVANMTIEIVYLC